MSQIDARCYCCDLLVASCGSAAELRGRAQAKADCARVLALPGVFIAAFSGTCGRCGEWFPEGTPICSERTADGQTTGYAAPCCLEAQQ